MRSTAPGHGQEDYYGWPAYKLEIYTPVDGEGKFVPQVERYGDKNVFEANRLITEDMKKEGTWVLKESDYHGVCPHCWRCKNPVIFRATAQWFISIDKNDLRKKALEEIKKGSLDSALGRRKNRQHDERAVQIGVFPASAAGACPSRGSTAILAAKF